MGYYSIYNRIEEALSGASKAYRKQVRGSYDGSKDINHQVVSNLKSKNLKKVVPTKPARDKARKGDDYGKVEWKRHVRRVSNLMGF